jgi:anti-sigma factor RsiW
MIDNEALSCQELVELVTDYLEGALDAAARAAFERHIAACGDCSRYLRQLEAIVRATGRLTPSDLTPAAEETLVQAFRGWSRSSLSGS